MANWYFPQTLTFGFFFYFDSLRPFFQFFLVSAINVCESDFDVFEAALKTNKTARIRAKPRMFRLLFKVYGAVII